MEVRDFMKELGLGIKENRIWASHSVNHAPTHMNDLRKSLDSKLANHTPIN